MHETRNFVTVLLVVAAFAWAFIAWLMLGDVVGLWFQRIASTALFLAMSAYLYYALRIEDKLPDHLCDAVGDMYYDVEGLSFMPTVRIRGGVAELCVYYQNRYENPVQGIVHLRPPADSFVIRPGVRDVHFAFTAEGGDFGAIHQPITVPDHLAGEVIEVELAAASFYPRSHGTRWRDHDGLPCGTLLVDWSGAAFKTGVHEVSGEIDLRHPARLHLAMPKQAEPANTRAASWRQERIEAGVAIA